MNRSSTAARRLTTAEPAAIAVVEINGPMASELVAKFWKPATGSVALDIDRIRFGSWQNSESNVGEQVVVCRTRDDRIEIHCHGGHQASARILKDLESAGARCGLDEFESDGATSDALSAESIRRAAGEDLGRAKTEKVAGILLDQWRGALSQSIERIRNLLDRKDITAASHAIEELQGSYAVGRYLVEPYCVVIAGPPNVGKSSLINAILGYQRVIVHEAAGTTRDVIEELTSIDGWPVRVHDTAGFRDSLDNIEQQGIAAARHELSIADLVLILVDESQGWTDAHQDILMSCPGRSMIVGTKHDLVVAMPEPTKMGCQMDVYTSAIENQGIESLLDAIAFRICPTPILRDQAILFRREQYEAISRLLPTQAGRANR